MSLDWSGRAARHHPPRERRHLPLRRSSLNRFKPIPRPHFLSSTLQRENQRPSTTSRGFLGAGRTAGGSVRGCLGDGSLASHGLVPRAGRMPRVTLWWMASPSTRSRRRRTSASFCAWEPRCARPVCCKLVIRVMFVIRSCLSYVSCLLTVPCHR